MLPVREAWFRVVLLASAFLKTGFLLGETFWCNRNQNPEENQALKNSYQIMFQHQNMPIGRLLIIHVLVSEKVWVLVIG